MTNRIGVLDSGLGGMTVLQKLINKRPNAEYLYLADNAYLPYGEKSEEKLQNRALKIAKFFDEQQIDQLVLACNTIMATALEIFRDDLRRPVYGVIEYGAKDALRQTKNKKIALFATERTVASKAYDKYLKEIDEFYAISCPELVHFIEKGRKNDREVRERVSYYLNQAIHRDVDTIILGCTHYPLFLDLYKELSPEIRYIDPAVSTVDHVIKNIDQDGTGKFSFYTTKEDKDYPAIIKELFQIKKPNIQNISL